MIGTAQPFRYCAYLFLVDFHETARTFCMHDALLIALARRGIINKNMLRVIICLFVRINFCISYLNIFVNCYFINGELESWIWHWEVCICLFRLMKGNIEYNTCLPIYCNLIYGMESHKNYFNFRSVKIKKKPKAVLTQRG